MQSMTAINAVALLVTQATGHQLPSLVTISGGTRAGKSFLADALLSGLKRKRIQATIISLDDYFRDIDDPQLPHDEAGCVSFDDLASYHGEEFVSHVTSLVDGSLIIGPSYNKVNNKRNEHQKTLLPNEVIIAEGLFAGMLLADAPNAMHLFVDTDQATCLERKIISDQAFYRASRNDAESNFREKIAPFWQTRIMPQMNFANIVITTT